MSKSKTGSESAVIAWETMRRRGKPPQFDTSTGEGRVQKHAYKAASAAIGRARKKEKDLRSDEEWRCVEEWMLSAPQRIKENGFICEFSGIKFDVDDDKFKTKGAGGTHLAPSPDRIDPTKGYFEGNVRWVLWAVNRAKGEMDDELFVDICREIVKRYDTKG